MQGDVLLTGLLTHSAANAGEHPVGQLIRHVATVVAFLWSMHLADWTAVHAVGTITAFIEMVDQFVDGFWKDIAEGVGNPLAEDFTAVHHPLDDLITLTGHFIGRSPAGDGSEVNCIAQTIGE